MKVMIMNKIDIKKSGNGTWFNEELETKENQKYAKIEKWIYLKYTQVTRREF